MFVQLLQLQHALALFAGVVDVHGLIDFTHHLPMLFVSNRHELFLCGIGFSKLCGQGTAFPFEAEKGLFDLLRDKGKVGINKFTFNAKDLPNGVYILNVSNHEKNIISKRIVVAH